MTKFEVIAAASGGFLLVVTIALALMLVKERPSPQRDRPD
jgi:hypothetical protein